MFCYSLWLGVAANGNQQREWLMNMLKNKIKKMNMFKNIVVWIDKYAKLAVENIVRI